VRLQPYKDLLRAPHVAALVGFALLARLPQGFASLAILLLVRHETDSYALAGATVAAMFVGVAVSAPILGRLVDRVGQTRVLIPAGIAEGAAFMAMALAGTMDAADEMFPALAIPLGLANPPVAASLRALWSNTLPVGVEPDTAFSLEAAAQELIWIVGPLLAAAMLAVTDPAAVVAAAGAIAIVGNVAFASLAPSRAWRSPPREHGRGALAGGGVRLLVILSGLLVATFIMTEVVVVAFCADRGDQDVAGVILAAWAGASLIGGLWHGSRHWTTDARVRLPWLVAAMPFGFAPLVAAWSTWSLAVLILSAGFLIAPVLACVYMVLGRLAPEGTVTEAFSWQNSAFVIGAGAGSALAGLIVDAGGARVGFVSVVLAATLAAAFLFLGRRSLVTTRPTAA
jgi:MFS family permease